MNEQPTLFNSTPLIHKADWLPPVEQAALKANAADQERRVLAYLQKHSQAGASQIWQGIRKNNEPLTSIRRSLTNLSDAGRVEKLEQTVTGVYGRSEHLWRICE